MIPDTPSIVMLTAVALYAVWAVRAWLRNRAEELPMGWLDEFSEQKYRPMTRLLSEDDFVFLSAQPGYVPAIGRKLRRDRCRVFNSYFRAIRRDFNRLHRLAKALAIISPEGAAMAPILFRQRLIFTYAVGRVRLRVILFRMGIGSVDVRPLVGAFERFSEQVLRARLVAHAS